MKHEIEKVLRKTARDRGMYVRAFSGGVVGACMRLNLDGSIVQTPLEPEAREWLAREGHTIWEWLTKKDRPLIWTPAHTAITYCLPDHLVTDEMRQALSEHLSLYLGHELNLDLLEKVRSQTSEIIHMTSFLMEDVIGYVQEMDIRKENEKNKKRAEDIAFDNAKGFDYYLSEDASFMQCFYPAKGKTPARQSTHYFIQWPDMIVRCDCHWKRFNWTTECKHEIVRNYDLKERQKS